VNTCVSGRLGANIEAKTPQGMTALSYSACYGFGGLAELLLRNGANLETADNVYSLFSAATQQILSNTLVS